MTFKVHDRLMCAEYECFLLVTPSNQLIAQQTRARESVNVY